MTIDLERNDVQQRMKDSLQHWQAPHHAGECNLVTQLEGVPTALWTSQAIVDLLSKSFHIQVHARQLLHILSYFDWHTVFLGFMAIPCKRVHQHV